MLNLESSIIHGNPEHIDVVREIFGHVVIFRDNFPDKNITFSIHGVYPNHYYINNPELDPEALLYILVPSCDIRMVWPGNCNHNNIDDVRFGCARRCGQFITSALTVSKGMKSLYICLSPKGDRIKGLGDLGI